MSRELKVCPTCGRPYPPEFKIRGPVRQRLVDLVRQSPEGISRKALMERLYSSDPSGGPETANTISVLVHLANLQLMPQGWNIRSDRGGGRTGESLYFFEQLHGDPVNKSA